MVKRDKDIPAGGTAITRSGAVYRALKRAILEQAVPPGAKLPEDSIGERLGVSRTLVREALLRLSTEGLVELRPNRGACVAQPSLQDGRDIFTVRIGLERLVVEALAGRLTAEQRKRIDAHIAAEEKAKATASTRSIRRAGEFPPMLAEMTGNALLMRYVDEVTSRCSLILAVYGRPHSSECGVSEHRALAAALFAGDVEQAVGLMSTHLEAITDRALLSREEPDLRDVLADYAREEGLGSGRRDG